jgi:hypothetical protein
MILPPELWFNQVYSCQNIDVFKRLYGESTIDMDLLFHVIDQHITLPDLVSEAINISDVAAFISRAELLLNTLSGDKRNLSFYFEKAAEDDAETKSIIKKYDTIVRDIDSVFNMRHAIVHSVVSNTGPVRWASQPAKLQELSASCAVFLALFDLSFRQELMAGAFQPTLVLKKQEERLSSTMKDVRRTFSKLKTKHKDAQRSLEKLETHLERMIPVLSGVMRDLGNKRDDDETYFSAQIVEVYFEFWAKISFALREVSSFRK